MSGLPADATVRLRYVRIGKGDVMRWVGGDMRSGDRACWTLDKARGLVYTVAGIKNGYVNFFKYDRVEGGKLGLIDDFLSLIEDKQSSRFAGDIYTIIRSSTASQPDDFTSVVCFAYHYFYGAVMRQYPRMDYLKGTNIKELSEDLIARIEGDEIENTT
jgi:hypothetical protein